MAEPSATFIARRQSSWQALEALTARARRDLARLSEAELGEFGGLYRESTGDLALAQRDYPAEPVAAYLNGLVAQAHAVIYQSEPWRWTQLRDFFAHTFPLLYRKLWPYTLASMALFWLPAIVIFIAVAHAPHLAGGILGEDAAAQLESRARENASWADIGPAYRSSAAAGILTNNISVMFRAFAGGMTAGLVTVLILVFNGLLLGAVFGLLQAKGLLPVLLEFVSAHGPIELSVIWLAGGCGLYMGDALLRPGLLARRDALVDRARESVTVILGAMPLLVLAGCIEGFLSPSAAPWAVKAAVGVATGIALYAYWWGVWPGRAGRRAAQAVSASM